MNVVLIGEESDVQIQAVARYLDADRIILIDRERIENEIQITFDLQGRTSVLKINDEPIEVSAVYWRNLDYYPFDGGGQYWSNTMSYYQLFLDTMFNASWWNGPTAFNEHFTKIAQYKLARALGVRMPRTIFTSDINDAYEFISQVKTAALKPVSGGQYLTVAIEANAEEVVPELIDYGNQPYAFQEFVKGKNIRTYVIGDKLYSAEMKTDEPDYRIAKNAKVIPIEISDELSQRSLDIAKALDLNWTAIDWIQPSDGDTVFLEANFSPMFKNYEDETGQPISQELAAAISAA
jgi:glutathione synthase/RimK-type ligase-like ATP-grasp enzyme